VYIESINEKHDEELAAAKAKIASLTRELRTNKEEVESLECDLTEAIETIDVSTPW
jgi:predicted RNase H-like nuclease (RuvC/YqgF family)